MEILNRKLSLLKGKVENSQPITIMIIGLGSVGCYLLDYLVSLGDSQLRLVVVGRKCRKDADGYKYYSYCFNHLSSVP